MKLKLNKKAVKTLSKDKKVMPQSFTDQVAGGYMTKTGCNGTTYACHSMGNCHTYYC